MYLISREPHSSPGSGPQQTTFKIPLKGSDYNILRYIQLNLHPLLYLSLWIESRYR